MKQDSRLDISKASAIRMLAYLALVAGLLLSAPMSILKLYYDAKYVGAVERLLEELNRKRAEIAGRARTDGVKDIRPLFLEGSTETIAGAALDRRVETVIKEVGGSVLSTKLGLDEHQVKERVITVSIDFEVDQKSVQQVLYKLETGMPILFIDALMIRSANGQQPGARMRLEMTVSGRWRGDV